MISPKTGYVSMLTECQQIKRAFIANVHAQNGIRRNYLIFAK